ncbi:MAG: hypothetical protein IJZ74_03405 [Clostridia bacterium]|nr:hypothetical protein [Clostridia bacterium]
MRQRIARLCPWIAGAAVIVIAALLCWKAVSLYTAGNALRDAQGVLLSPIFTRENVTACIASISLPLGICLLTLTAAAAAALLNGISSRRSPRRKPAYAAPLPHACLLRSLVLALALALIAAGVMNGGLYDVLVKAINICTECIGLG